jgi:hypothetical protein
VLLPESAVLEGFTPLSKLKVFGLSECGDAVVELAIQILESVVFCKFTFVVVDVKVDVPLLFELLFDVVEGVWLWETLICPNKGLGEESGDDVSDETYLGETEN